MQRTSLKDRDIVRDGYLEGFARDGEAITTSGFYFNIPVHLDRWFSEDGWVYSEPKELILPSELV
jgi:hypothetical protein